MLGLINLRPYQRECIEALHKRWDGGDNRVASVLSCGLGKTYIFTHIVAEWLRANPTKRALLIAHTDELVGQIVESMRKAAPDMTVGIVKAGRNEIASRAIVSSQQTLARENRRAQIRNVGMIIIDECHRTTRKNTYGQILEHFGAFDPNPRVIVAGFTATLVRGDREKLSEVWQPGETFTRNIAFGIRHGYLLPMKGKRIIVPDLKLRDVKRSGGDYQDSSLADELERSLAPDIVAKAYVAHASDRLGIGFAPTIESAYAFAEAFNENGIVSEVVHSSTAAYPLAMQERRAILRRLHEGTTQVVWSVSALTFGFDEPRVSAVVWARPTSQSHVYQQGVCRAGRPNLELPPADRGHALILDVVGSSEDHSLSSLLDLSLPDPPYVGDGGETEDDGFCLAHLSALPCFLCGSEDSGESLPGFEPELYAGPVEVVDFDPLGAESAHAWGQTAGGTYFLPAGKSAYVFLVPENLPGTYGVAWCTSTLHEFAHRQCLGIKAAYFGGPYCRCGRQHVGARGGWENGYRRLSLEEATSWGVDVAIELGGREMEMLSTKKKEWRKSKDVSDAQKANCRTCGIDWEGMTKGEVSDAIDRVMASRRIDPVVNVLVSMQATEIEETE